MRRTEGFNVTIGQNNGWQTALVAALSLDLQTGVEFAQARALTRYLVVPEQ
jgi:hypothetical protein